jgi:hypothetical protein
MLIWLETSESRCLEWLQVLVFTHWSITCRRRSRFPRMWGRDTRAEETCGDDQGSEPCGEYTCDVFSAFDPFWYKPQDYLVYRPFQSRLCCAHSYSCLNAAYPAKLAKLVYTDRLCHKRGASQHVAVYPDSHIPHSTYVSFPLTGAIDQEYTWFIVSLFRSHPLVRNHGVHSR